MSEQPSEILRRAAKVLREHVEAATPGHWTVEQDDDVWELYAGRGESHGYKLAKCMKRNQRYMEYWPNDADSAYMTLMHPAVGLALADWLDLEAVECEEADRLVRAGFGMRNETRDERAALVVARAILREAPDA